MPHNWGMAASPKLANTLNFIQVGALTHHHTAQASRPSPPIKYSGESQPPHHHLDYDNPTKTLVSSILSPTHHVKRKLELGHYYLQYCGPKQSRTSPQKRNRGPAALGALLEARPATHGLTTKPRHL